MRLARALERLVREVLRFPAAVAAGVALLAIAGGALAVLTLRPSAGTDTLVGRGSESFKATDRFHKSFGGDAVYVLIRGSLVNLVDTSDLSRLIGLEGCLSGNVPAGASVIGGPASPCGALARSRPVRVVYGPGTFINEAVHQINTGLEARIRAAQAEGDRAALNAQRLAATHGASKAEQKRAAAGARQLIATAFTRSLAQLAVQYGIKGPPRINDPTFVNTLVFDPERPTGTPKPRFAYLFPNANAALVQVRLQPGLTDAQRRDAIARIRAATQMPRFRLGHGQRYVVTGAPVVVSDLTSSISHSIVVLLIAALLVMAATLALVFSSRLRLLPLAVALAAAGLVFGAMALAGVSLTMASIAVLPVLIGLAVDYAVQLQSRFDEAEDEGRRAPDAAARRAARAGGPTIATAAIATAAGFLVLLLSPVPMVRGFGLLLVVGVVVAFVCAITAGFATLVLARRAGPAPRGLAPLRSALGGAGELVALPARSARRLLAGTPAARATQSARGSLGRLRDATLALALRRPGRVLGVGATLAVMGLLAGTQTPVVSDIQRLVPAQLPALRDLNTLQRETGVSGEVDVTVSGADLTDPKVLRWMSGYQSSLLTAYRYSPDRPCGHAQLCPALSLPDLFSGSTGSGAAANGLTRSQIRALLDAVPPYFSSAVITRDRRLATLAFGIKLMPLDRQKAVIDTMRRNLDPPPGVHAELAGLPVLAAEANAAVSSQWRRLLTLVLGLLVVAGVLLVAFRRAERALVPVVPIVLASGWSALALFLTGVPLNPMSVTLGALVIAISTEFSVLLSERYRQERGAGHDVAAALERTYRSTGRAVATSGLTAIAGFAVLILSDIRMLRDFGLVTVLDLAVSILGVMVVLPAVLALAERGELRELAARAQRRLRALRLRPRARAA